MTDSVVRLVQARREESGERGVLDMWTVYDSPKDYPGEIVARRFETGGGNPEPIATGDVISGDIHKLRTMFTVLGFH